MAGLALTGTQRWANSFDVTQRMLANGPADDQAVEAVDDGREVHLAGGDLELGDVSQPFLVGGCSLEVSVDDVFWRRADFAKVRAVPTLFVGGNDQAFLFHQALHDFLAEMQMAPAKCRTQPPVTVTLVITLKDISNGNPSISVFVRSSQPRAMIKIRTACEIKRFKQL